MKKIDNKNPEVNEKVVKAIFSCVNHDQLSNVQDWIEKMPIYDPSQKELLISLITAKSQQLLKTKNIL